MKSSILKLKKLARSTFRSLQYCTSCAFTPLSRRGVLVLLPLILAACGGGSSSGSGPGGPAYTISGSIDHLSAAGLVLSDGSESVTIGAGATSFSFPTALSGGSSFNVIVTGQPVNQSCVVNNGSGAASAAAITSISIACNSVITQPVSVGVYPVGSATSADSRVFLPVTMVGNNTVSINAVLDTGSAGVVLNAFDIFPSNMVTSSGFVFPPGQSSMTYNGVTVTNVSATRSYGGQGNSTTDIGNLGFAQITVGTQGNITTAVIPVLFAYQFQRDGVNTTPGQLANLVGINPAIGQVVVGGGGQAAGNLVSTSVCTPQSTTTCGEVSPFRSVGYGQGVDAGYTLNQFALVNCSIDTAGSCQPGNFLTLGLDNNLRQSFPSTALDSCQPIVVSGAGNQEECSQVIPNVTISSGSSSFTGPAIFDSGAPAPRIEVPTGDSFPSSLPTGTAINLTTPSNISWQFNVGTGPTAVNVDQDAGSGNFSNTGIAFFTQHSLLVDYANQSEGWN